MKRTVKPFVVERKRRTAAAGDGPPSIWSKADGAAFREQVESERREDMPAKPATPRPAAHASNNPRILDVSSPKPESVAPATIAEKPTRTKRASSRSIGPEGEVGGQRDKAFRMPDKASVVATATTQPPPAAAAPRSPQGADARMSEQRAKREAARQRLPLHERWKWDLPI